MKIEHIAIYVKHLQNSIDFYAKYFKGTASSIYVNPVKNFSSCFICFEGGARLELMHQSQRSVLNSKENLGIHHLALSTGSREKVNMLTDILKKDGYQVYSEPRVTGDGYYESIILDPDNNMVEITE